MDSRPATEGGARAALLVIAALALALRVAWIGTSPPGLNQDEAANTWNTWCLVETGRDQAGASTPIFSARALGEHRSTLFLYLLAPVVRLTGPGIVGPRLVAAFLGLAAVLLLFWVGRRLYGGRVGLLAALSMAVDPWAVEQGRWANEAAAVPALVLGPLALLLWARDGRAWRFALAGLVTGLCCYGYQAVRLFWPAFMLFAAPFSRLGRRATVIAACGFLALFAPLAYRHLSDPDVNKRGVAERVWDAGAPPLQAGLKALARYLPHFGPDFLFVSGDHSPFNHPGGGGELNPVLAPFLIVGLATLCRRRARADGLLGAWLLAYPLGDLLHRHPSMHALRSLPGEPALMLLGAVGAERAWRVAAPWVGRRAGALLVAVALAVTTGGLARRLLVDVPRDPTIRAAFHADLVEACRWLKPRIGPGDAVFWTTTRLNQPYVLTLVLLKHDARKWMAEPRDLRPQGEFDLCARYGSHYFLYADWWFPYLQAAGADPGIAGVWFVLRPGELEQNLRLGAPVHVVRDDAGRPLIQVHHVSFGGSPGGGPSETPP